MPFRRAIRHPDERIERSGAVAVGVRTTEQPIFPAQSRLPDLIPRGAVGYFETAVIKITRERAPPQAGVTGSAGKIALSRDLLQLCVEPGCQFDLRPRRSLPHLAPASGMFFSI